MVVTKDFILASYYEECETLDHAEAVAQVAGATGREPEEIEAVIEEEMVGVAA